MKKQLFTGSAVSLVTPMGKDSAVDNEALSALIEFQLESGSDAIVVCAAAGEDATLTADEHMDVVEHTVLAVGRRVPVIAGVGGNDTSQTTRLAREASIRGADGLLLTNPYYNQPGHKGIVQHFLTVVEAVGLPVILCDDVSRTASVIPFKGHRELIEHPLLLASVECGLPVAYVADLALEFGEDMAFYAGRDNEIVPYLSLGAMGAVSALANLVPRDINDICHLYFTGRVQESLALQLQYLPLYSAMEQNLVPAVKEALNQIGHHAGGCRLPLAPLSDDEKDALVQEMLKADLL